MSLLTRWKQCSLPYTTPAGTDRLDVLVQCMRQHSKARLWIDDISIVGIPVDPLDLTAAGSVSTSEETPYEE